jgi:hypothetical protein
MSKQSRRPLADARDAIVALQRVLANHGLESAALKLSIAAKYVTEKIEADDKLAEQAAQAVELALNAVERAKDGAPDVLAEAQTALAQAQQQLRGLQSAKAKPAQTPAAAG